MVDLQSVLLAEMEPKPRYSGITAGEIARMMREAMAQPLPLDTRMVNTVQILTKYCVTKEA